LLLQLGESVHKQTHKRSIKKGEKRTGLTPARKEIKKREEKKKRKKG
jgi:hypothetical protein